MTSLLFAAVAYVLGAFLLALAGLRVTGAMVPPSLRSLEDDEQARAVGPRRLARRAEPDPYATLS